MRLSLIGRQWCLFGCAMIPALWDIVDVLIGVPQGLKLCFHNFGHDAYRFLILTLCITPLRHLGISKVGQWRRPLGLACFTYALMHVTLYVSVGKKFDFTVIFHDFLTRKFLIFGLLTFLILLALALTSTQASQKRLGRSWKTLHKTVYIAMILASIHYCLAFKIWHIRPFVESFIAFLVMGSRAFF